MTWSCLQPSALHLAKVLRNMRQPIANLNAVHSTQHNNDSVGVRTNFCDDLSEEVFDRAETLAGGDFIQKIDFGSKVASSWGQDRLVDVSVANEMMGHRAGLRLSVDDVQHFGDVEDAVVEAVDVVGSCETTAGGFGIEAGDVLIDGGAERSTRCERHRVAP